MLTKEPGVGWNEWIHLNRGKNEDDKTEAEEKHLDYRMWKNEWQLNIIKVNSIKTACKGSAVNFKEKKCKLTKGQTASRAAVT